MLIKLRDINKEDYENLAVDLSRKFSNLNPKKLKLRLEDFFEDFRGEMEFNSFVNVYPIVDKSINYYELSFDFIFDENYKELSSLIKEKELNRKVVRELRRFYHKIYDDKKLESLESVFELFEDEKDLFEFVTSFFVDLRYRYNSNYLHTHNIYTGYFKNQGLMNYLFESLNKFIDLEDLDYIEIDDIVEKNTCNMFNKLRKKIPNDDYLVELLKRKYVKSPFMRAFYKLGFKKMNIIADDNFISTIRANKSDELSFSISKDF